MASSSIKPPPDFLLVDDLEATRTPELTIAWAPFQRVRPAVGHRLDDLLERAETGTPFESDVNLLSFAHAAPPRVRDKVAALLHPFHSNLSELNTSPVLPHVLGRPAGKINAEANPDVWMLKHRSTGLCLTVASDLRRSGGTRGTSFQVSGLSSSVRQKMIATGTLDGDDATDLLALLSDFIQLTAALYRDRLPAPIKSIDLTGNPRVLTRAPVRPSLSEKADRAALDALLEWRPGVPIRPTPRVRLLKKMTP